MNTHVMITRGSSKVSTAKRKELMYNLCQAMSVVRSPTEAASVLTDLLTPQEIETIAKRLYIGEMLIRNIDYETIRKELHVGTSTIARVNTWLHVAGDGFKVIISRKRPRKTVSEDERYDPFSWHNFKKRYSRNFWPLLLLEKIIQESDADERQKIQRICEVLELQHSTFKSGESKREFHQVIRHFTTPPGK